MLSRSGAEASTTEMEWDPMIVAYIIGNGTFCTAWKVLQPDRCRLNDNNFS